jgi:hypothetical protein
MYRHHQTNIQTIGTEDGESEIPNDMALRNGELHAWRKWRPPQVPAPHRKPQDEGNLDPLIRERTRTARARNTWPNKRNRHNWFHPPTHGTEGEGERCHHMFDSTRKKLTNQTERG